MNMYDFIKVDDDDLSDIRATDIRFITRIGVVNIVYIETPIWGDEERRWYYPTLDMTRKRLLFKHRDTSKLYCIKPDISNKKLINNRFISFIECLYIFDVDKPYLWTTKTFDDVLDTWTDSYMVWNDAVECTCVVFGCKRSNCGVICNGYMEMKHQIKEKNKVFQKSVDTYLYLTVCLTIGIINIPDELLEILLSYIHTTSSISIKLVRENLRNKPYKIRRYLYLMEKKLYTLGESYIDYIY